jgi:hypothetical protein
MRSEKNVHRNMAGKPDRKRLLRRHISMWEVNIRMDFKGGV